jgi:hypothetical protein
MLKKARKACKAELDRRSKTQPNPTPLPVPGKGVLLLIFWVLFFLNFIY